MAPEDTTSQTTAPVTGDSVPAVADSAEPEEAKLPLQFYLQTIRGTPDEVWTLFLRSEHRFDRRTMTGWRNLLRSHKDGTFAG